MPIVMDVFRDWLWGRYLLFTFYGFGYFIIARRCVSSLLAADICCRVGRQISCWETSQLFGRGLIIWNECWTIMLDSFNWILWLLPYAFDDLIYIIVGLFSLLMFYLDFVLWMWGFYEILILESIVLSRIVLDFSMILESLHVVFIQSCLCFWFIQLLPTVKWLRMKRWRTFRASWLSSSRVFPKTLSPFRHVPDSWGCQPLIFHHFINDLFTFGP